MASYQTAMCYGYHAWGSFRPAGLTLDREQELLLEAMARRWTLDPAEQLQMLEELRREERRQVQEALGTPEETRYGGTNASPPGRAAVPVSLPPNFKIGPANCVQRCGPCAVDHPGRGLTTGRPPPIRPRPAPSAILRASLSDEGAEEGL